MAIAPHLRTADDGTLALLAQPDHEGIVDAIELAVEARTTAWAKRVHRQRGGEGAPSPRSTVRDWQLRSLRRASDHVLAEVHAELEIEVDSQPETIVAPIVVDMVLEGTGETWQVEIAELRPHRLLSPRFGAAFDYAFAHHADETRKGTQIPYVAHLLGVTSLLLEMQPNSEDEAIAALLHDVVEDEGGMAAATEILRHFGPDVLRIVLANSDSTKQPKPDWCERKTKYIAAIAHKAPDELRVSLADKLHNARAILMDYREHQEALWERFNATGEQTRWYYRELAAAFDERKGDLGAGAVAALGELKRTVRELEALSPGGAFPSNSPCPGTTTDNH